MCFFFFFFEKKDWHMKIEENQFSNKLKKYTFRIFFQVNKLL